MNMGGFREGKPFLENPPAIFIAAVCASRMSVFRLVSRWRGRRSSAGTHPWAALPHWDGPLKKVTPFEG